MTLDPRNDQPQGPSQPDAGSDTTVTPVPAVTTTPLEPGAGQPAPAGGAAFSGTTPPARAQGSRLRWFGAVGVVVLVLLASMAVALALTGASSTAVVTGYVPAGSEMYGEVRLDLPGDQKKEIGEFLSAFPGFADQAALDTKLD